MCFSYKTDPLHCGSALGVAVAKRAAAVESFEVGHRWGAVGGMKTEGGEARCLLCL